MQILELCNFHIKNQDDQFNGTLMYNAYCSNKYKITKGGGGCATF